MATEIDYMEYATDGAAQAAYVTNSDPDDGTGGTITHSGGYTIHNFTSNGTFNPGHEREVEYLIVAGGGGGGYNYDGSSTAGGGGGAGGIISNSDTVSGDKSVVVGAGGTGSCTNNVNGTNGNNSSFNGETATGGGGGATYIGGSGTGRAGGNGGSGGGGSYGGAGGTGVAGQGYAGGAGSTGTGQPGGGGGGASEVGTAGASGAHGGDGVTSSISGSSVTYGGGGGGGIGTGTAGNGGAGGGGAGGSGSTPGGDGTDGLGGGGGAGGAVGVGGGDGGDGVVIVRYLTTYTDLQSYSESTIKTQGSYSLKGVATTDALNKTLTYTLGSPVDLSGIDTLRLDIRSSRTGSNIKVGIHDSGGTTTETTPNITDANTWQTVVWDISAVADADKDAIDSIIITIANADAGNTFYIDNFFTAEDVTITAEPFIVTTSLSSSGGVVIAGYGYVYEQDSTGAVMDVAVRTKAKVGKGVLKRKNLKYIYHMINTHGKDITMTIYVDGEAQTPTFTINTTERKMVRIEDVPNFEGYKFDIRLTGEDLTDDELEIYGHLALQHTVYGE